MEPNTSSFTSTPATTNPADPTSASVPPTQPQPGKKNKLLACTACRARKLGCNRVHPCHNCIRSGAECIFPARRRVQRPRKTKNAELLQRLSRLETIVGKAGIENLLAADREQQQDRDSDPAGAGTGGTASPKEQWPHVDASSSSALPLFGKAGPSGGGGEEASSRVQSFLEEFQGSRREGDGGGGDGRAGDPASLDRASTRYLSAQFWANLCGEVEGLRQTLEHSTDSDPESESDEEAQFEGATPESGIVLSTANSTSGHDLAGRSPDPSASGLLPGYLLIPGHAAPPQHPSPEQVRYLTTTYFENFDVIVKILHRPTISAALLAFADSGCDRGATLLSPAHEALFFAIYYGAVTTLPDASCRGRLGAPRDVLARRLQPAVERALALADYLNSDTLESLQALVIYVTCLRSHTRSRASWALLSLPIRLARALELHREGGGRRARRGARPSIYETELRRRLWWQLVVLDVRAVEDRGTEPAILRGSYDTRLPLNVNDEDFGPDTGADHGEAPDPPPALKEREGPTDMTFSLCTAQSSGIFLYLNYVSDGAAGSRPPPSEEETVAHAQHLEAQFVTALDGVDLTALAAGPHVGAYIASFTVRLIILKLWLINRYPVNRRREQQQQQQQQRVQREGGREKAAAETVELPMRMARITRHEIIVSTQPANSNTNTRDSANATADIPRNTRDSDDRHRNSNNGRNAGGAVSREATLRTAVSIMELSHRASTTGPLASRFGWWSATYVQWHPLAVALAELYHYYGHPGAHLTGAERQGDAGGFAALVDRAWAIVEAVFPLWADRIADTKRGTLWRPIKKLYRKAKAARAAALGGGAAISVPVPGSTASAARTAVERGTDRFAAAGGVSAFYDQAAMSNPSSVPPHRHYMGPTSAATSMLDMSSVGISPQPPPILSSTPTSTSTSTPAMPSEPWMGSSAMSTASHQQHHHSHPHPHSHSLPMQQQYPIPSPNTNIPAAGAPPWFGDPTPWPDISFDLLAGVDGGVGGGGGVGFGGGNGWDTMDWSTWDEFVDDTYAEGPLTSSSDGS